MSSIAGRKLHVDRGFRLGERQRLGGPLKSIGNQKQAVCLQLVCYLKVL